MAVDEALLESAASNQSWLRFYGWSEPTLSLGYFQHHADRAAHVASRDCPLVRRQSGGGAIVHDREVTYSLALPRSHPLADDAMQLYRAVHDGVIAVLEAHGVSGRQCAETADLAPATEPFLCFERRSPGDVLVGESKVCGSAQHRKGGAILQHGSLLVGRSACTSELPGLEELAGKSMGAEALIQALAAEIAGRLHLSLEPTALPSAERRAAEELRPRSMPPWLGTKNGKEFCAGRRRKRRSFASLRKPCRQRHFARNGFAI